MRISLDIGRRYSKIYTAGTSFKFRTTCEFISDTAYNMTKYDSIKIDGKSYILEQGSTIVNDDKSIDEVYFVTFIYSLARVAYSTGKTDFEVATGLPVDHYKSYAKNIINKFKDTSYAITYKGKMFTVNVKSVEVYPEAALCSTESDVLVVDIGGLTVDATLFEDNELKAYKSYELGTNKLYGYISNDLNKKYGAMFSDEEIEKALQKGFLIIKNKKEYINFTNYKKSFLLKILSSLRADFQTSNLIIEFIGGGSLLYADIIKKHFDIDIDTDSQFLNAKAFYRGN